ncbi:AAA family ATPase [Xylanibacter muris]|uniref:AAA family ATPase n=1 Tax=Xylanibacter muris TaxID=2736290 RepID=UPI000FFEF578|nr:AAA family ATPase [Xylanibacter muris]RXE72079.1 anticodon nuclease [Muribaculaceae bacterium Isolate-002 (NCI)]
MGQSLTEIAAKLRDTRKKVQLIYAFNGVGKTRLSREFKELISPKDGSEESDGERIKVLYYNAFTEDLFYWDNDLDEDKNRKLIIHPNSFTDWVFKVQGQENNVLKHFQHYTNDKLTPSFNEEYAVKDKDNQDVTIRAYSEIKFSLERGNDEKIDNIKISKGEESCLIWCVFYSLLGQVVEVLNIADKTDRDTDQFDDLEYIFIDDPVSSLDENHLIELAVNIAELIKDSKSDLKFIITTHNPLFYNVLYNELCNADKEADDKTKKSMKQRLEKLEDGTYVLHDSNDSPFSYHLFLLSELEKATNSGQDCIQKYHFNFLRNILEKTATFLGYKQWKELLPHDAREAYYNRIINLCSHSKHNGEEVSIVHENDKRVLRYLVKEVIIPTYHFKSVIDNNQNG